MPHQVVKHVLLCLNITVLTFLKSSRRHETTKFGKLITANNPTYKNCSWNCINTIQNLCTFKVSPVHAFKTAVTSDSTKNSSICRPWFFLNNFIIIFKYLAQERTRCCQALNLTAQLSELGRHVWMKHLLFPYQLWAVTNPRLSNDRAIVLIFSSL